MERAHGCNDDPGLRVVVKRHPHGDARREHDRCAKDDDEDAGHEA
jgi:hypothetical protein